MKASELIFKLKELKEIHGDLTVTVEDRFNESKDTPYSNYVGVVDYVHEALTHERYFRVR